MKRSTLGRLAALAAVAMLVAAGLAVGTSGARDDARLVHAPAFAMGTVLRQSATIDATSPESMSAVGFRDAGESRRSSERPFAAVLAALVLLVSLAAALGARSSGSARRWATTRFDARRRAPPLLLTC